jgi:succinoglycan biosynthesis protein ExoW
MVENCIQRFATVIPFYQRERGILQRSLNSALCQGVDNTIFVVDDCSPVPAAEELKSAGLSNDERITLITLADNQGVAAARNVGIEQAVSDYDAVCFLDSDDEWQEGHLQRATAALQHGADFYFSDHIRNDWEKTKFEKRGISSAEYLACETDDALFKVNGHDFAIRQLREHIVQTSTVVVSSGLLSEARFPTRLSLLEDDFMWVKLAQAGATVLFSTEVGARLGKGVNISIAETWGTEESFVKTSKLLAAWQEAYAHIAYDKEIDALRDERIAGLKTDFVQQFFRGRARASVRMKECPALPGALCTVLRRKVTSKRRGSQT